MDATILFCFAHPDDESFCGAGTAMKCSDAGMKTVLVTATSGQRGSAGDPPVCAIEDLGACREQELRRAAAIIGFDEVHLLGWQDRQLAAVAPELMRGALVPIIRRTKPPVVVTFDPNGYNLHPDHVAISRFTMDAIAVAADVRWCPEHGEPHLVRRLLWTPPIAPWDAALRQRLDEEPGVDFIIDVSRWRDRREAALRAHRSQHESIDRCFFNQPDPARILDREIWRQGWGPRVTHPSSDIFEALV